MLGTRWQVCHSTGLPTTSTRVAPRVLPGGHPCCLGRSSLIPALSRKVLSRAGVLCAGRGVLCPQTCLPKKQRHPSPAERIHGQYVVTDESLRLSTAVKSPRRTGDESSPGAGVSPQVKGCANLGLVTPNLAGTPQPAVPQPLPCSSAGVRADPAAVHAPHPHGVFTTSHPVDTATH